MSENTPYTPPGANVADSATEFGELNLFSAQGRIGRVRYLAYSFGVSFVGMFILMILMAIIMAAIGEAGMIISNVIYIIGLIALTIISIIFGVKRLHDLDKSGWLYLVMIIPIVSFFFALYLLFAPGNSGANQYGNPPPPNSTGVVVVAWLVPVAIILIGILAAIAVPAYQGYIERAQELQMQQQYEQR